MFDLVYLNKEYVKFAKEIGKDPRKPVTELEWKMWVKYRDDKWPESSWRKVGHNTLKFILR